MTVVGVFAINLQKSEHACHGEGRMNFLAGVAQPSQRCKLVVTPFGLKQPFKPYITYGRSYA